MLHDVVDDVHLQLFKEGGITEKVGHADEDLLDQDPGFLRIGGKQLDVIRQPRAVGDHHPALDAPQHRGPLVIGKVDPAAFFQDGVDPGKGFVVGKKLLLFLRADDGGIAGKIQDLIHDAVRGEHEIGQAGIDGASGHAVEFGAFRGLDDHQAAVLLHDLDAAGAVRAGAGHDHGDGPFLLLLRKGGEENVDGVVEHPVDKFIQVKLPVPNGHVVLGRDEINGVGADRHFVFRLQDMHLCMLPEDIGHQALIVGREMLDDHEAQPAVGGHVLEKLLESLQPSRRCPDADDQGRTGMVFLRLCLYDGFLCHQITSFG